ncbi:MAG: amino acid--tRNA ligase-related protein [Bacilli bacterium]|nr:amino acid--tRNA ligase-related protein [Bacilli bacterium]
MYGNDRKEESEKKIMENKYETMYKRSLIENYIRSMLIKDNYIEVRTPIINRYADIAPITQFKVVSPLESSKLFLRIAPTEQLKKLIFYGYDKIFEFSTNFRDDSVDDSHLFEFTSLEIMEKGTNVYDKMNQTEQIIKGCMNYCINNGFNNEFGEVFNFIDRKWPRIDIIEYIIGNYGVNTVNNFSEDELINIFSKLGIPKGMALEKNSIISFVVDSVLSNSETPVFIGDYPWDIEGPAKKSAILKGKERYELYYKGLELANMSSTLTDYNQLREWYFDTLSKKNEKENENYLIDLELLDIFKQKLPESAVLGIGIDRLVMLLLNKEIISDVVCFDNKKKKILK